MLHAATNGVWIECLLRTLVASVLMVLAGKVNAQSIVADGQVFANGSMIAGSQPSPFDAGSSLIVGGSAQGSLAISDGGSVFLTLNTPFDTTKTSRIGFSNGVIGNMIVTGQNSTFNFGNNIIIGYFGTGTLTVEDGAHVINDGPALTGDSAFSVIGANAGSIGTVNVRGAGSSWMTGSQLMVGDAGTGTLNISDGGSVTTESGSSIGSQGGSGTVLVSGLGSIWYAGNVLIVGGAGDGTLNITDGARVNTVSQTVIGQSASAFESEATIMQGPVG
ncbi:hypothetical protein LJR231_004442 [Phyllobacterium sp. LjRoot231]|uniref:hypothetical protein n=1 Tax=Phyllobacterium sp. LjRoot231 TaxID=3342289 RepID=UPI003ECF377D